MQKQIILIILIMLAYYEPTFCQRSDTTLKYLRHLNLDSYKNKPVESFMAIIPNNFNQIRIGAPGNPKIAQVLSVSYSDNVFIWIYVYTFQFMNPRSETMTWDMNLFRKENVDHIEVWKGVDCYNGCPDDAPSVAKPPKGKGRN